MRRIERGAWVAAMVLLVGSGRMSGQDPSHHGPMGVEGFQLLSTVPFAPGKTMVFQQIVPWGAPPSRSIPSS